MHISTHGMPVNAVGNHFSKSFHTVIILLTTIQMNQNETLSWELLISGMWKTYVWTNYISTVDVPTVAFLYGQKVV